MHVVAGNGFACRVLSRACDVNNAIHAKHTQTEANTRHFASESADTQILTAMNDDTHVAHTH